MLVGDEMRFRMEFGFWCLRLQYFMFASLASEVRVGSACRYRCCRGQLDHMQCPSAGSGSYRSCLTYLLYLPTGAELLLDLTTHRLTVLPIY